MHDFQGGLRKKCMILRIGGSWSICWGDLVFVISGGIGFERVFSLGDSQFWSIGLQLRLIFVDDSSKGVLLPFNWMTQSN